MPNAGDLRTAILAWTHRKDSDFYSGSGVSMILRAMNNARLYAERRIDFELSKADIQVEGVGLLTGGALSTAKLLGTATSASVKKLWKGFLNAANGKVPIDIISHDAFVRRLKTHNTSQDLTQPVPSVVSSPFFLVQLGGSIFVYPADETQLGTTFTAYATAYLWLPDYGSTTITGSATATSANHLVASAGSFVTNNVTIGSVVRNTTTGASALITAVTATDLTLNADIFVSGNAYSINVVGESDFLLTNCFDWLMYRSVYELNFFLKEDERVRLSETLVSDTWDSMVKWNNNMIQQAVEDFNLD